MPARRNNKKNRQKLKTDIRNEVIAMEIQYKTLVVDEIRKELFAHFIRRQAVTKCWRKVDGQWVIKDDPFIDDWTEKDYEVLVSCLKNTAQTGGFVHAAFCDGKLKGFVSVEPSLFGGAEGYLDLSSIHVSKDLRGKGVGARLFAAAKAWAAKRGAKKLYISAHSAVESQAFYKKMGCVEAQVYHKEHVERELFDCQLEYVL